jgi:hypothetical protein
MHKKFGKIAQTTAEYAVLIAVVVGAVVAMQIYVRRGLQGRVKDVVDHVEGTSNNGEEIFSTSQYEPYYSVSAATSSRNAQETRTLRGGGAGETTANEQTTQNRQSITGWDLTDTANLPTGQ